MISQKKPSARKSPDEYLIEEFQKGLQKWGLKSNQDHAEKGEKAWNIFRISEIGGCQAAITRDWMGERGLEDGESLLRMHDGTWTHTALREIFQFSDIKLLHEERRLSKKYVVLLEEVVKVPLTLIGHQDNGFEFGGREIVIDFKKASTFSYDKMEDGEVSDTYYDQMQGYLDITGCSLGILFVKSVDGRVNAITIERDQKHFQEEVLVRLARTALLRKRNEIGRRDFHQGLPPCTYCRHRVACWSIDGPLEDRGTLVDQNHPQFDNVRAAVELKMKADEYAAKAEEAKSDARATALSLFKKLGTRKIVSAVGGISWTSFKRKTVRLKEDKKPEALRKGLAEEVETTVEYPLFQKAREQ